MSTESSPLAPGRRCDAHDGPITLFIIGMRINRLHRPDKWLPVARAMPVMLKELAQRPDRGLLGWELLRAGLRTIVTMQYWRDFEGLHAYAHDPELAHMPAWRAFNRGVKGNDAVGIFHETYVIPAGAHESIYVAMPPFGLGKAAGLLEASGNRVDARGRMGAAGG